MAQKVNHLLGKLDQAQTLEDVQEVILSVRDHYEIEHIVYHWISADGGQFGVGSYDLNWVQRYVDRDYLRIDPVIIGCFNRFHPTDWKKFDWSSKQARLFREDAIKYGVGNQGFSIPIRGPNGQFALFSLSHTCTDKVWAKFTQANQRDWILIAHFFNHKALELSQDRIPPPSRTLSPRETDALAFLAMGYSRGQIAELLKISEHTLRAYIESARHKMNALNTTHAVAQAMADGLIFVGGAARAAAGDWPGRGSVKSLSDSLEQSSKTVRPEIVN